MSNILVVAGHFGDDPHPSGYANKLFQGIQNFFKTEKSSSFTFYNGGSWDLVFGIMGHIKEYDIIFWFPDVSNDKPLKLVEDIKANNPRAILITSKNNVGEKYTTLHLIARALKVKSNLLVEFTRDEKGMILATILDPLGNAFAYKEADVKRVSFALFSRVMALTKFTRSQSVRIDGDQKIDIEVPDKPEFFDIVKKKAAIFHELIYAVNQDRFLGNVSFRCPHGFPSFRNGDWVFVSRRNIDKTGIDRSGFVPVLTSFGALYNHTVEYVGAHKPSVDTPIQVALYGTYTSVNFMLHSHTYIEGAPFTKSVIPCGAMEEFEEIRELVPGWDTPDFCINLKGHGSIVFASDVDYISKVTYYARKFPELACSGM